MDFAFIWIFLMAEIITAFIYCFYGYRFFRTVMAVYIFMMIFPGIMSFFADVSTLDPMVTILIALGIAAFVAFLSFALFKFAIFLCGGLLGLIIATIINSFVPMDDTVLLITKIALFVVFGIIAYFLKKGIVIIVSSLCGAYTFSLYVYYIIHNLNSIVDYKFYDIGKMADAVFNNYSSTGIWFILPIILGVLGIIIQGAVTARPKKELKNT